MAGPSTLLVAGTAETLSRSLSIVSNHEEAVCPTTMVLAVHPVRRSLEQLYQGASRAAGDLMDAVKALGIRKVDLLARKQVYFYGCHQALTQL